MLSVSITSIARAYSTTLVSCCRENPSNSRSTRIYDFVATRLRLETGLAALKKLPIEQLDRVDLWHRHRELASGRAQQPLDVPLLVGPTDQAEVLLE